MQNNAATKSTPMAHYKQPMLPQRNDRPRIGANVLQQNERPSICDYLPQRSNRLPIGAYVPQRIRHSLGAISLPSKRRLMMCLVGVVLSGAGCGMMKCAAFGIDPFQSLLRGLAAATGTSFGVTFLVMGVAAVLFALRFARSILGIGTVFTLLLQGTATDLAARMLDTAFPDPSIPVRCLLFAAGYFLLALFSAMYFAAELGVSPYDSISRTLAMRFHPANFKNARILTDFTCIGGAVLLFHLAGRSLADMTGMIGIGTILTAALLGPLIEGIRRRWIDPLLA